MEFAQRQCGRKSFHQTTETEREQCFCEPSSAYLSMIIEFYKVMLFGSIFEEGVSSLKNSEENDLDRMRKEIRQNIREAQDCIG